MTKLEEFLQSKHPAATKLLLIWFKQREAQGIKNKISVRSICKELNLSHMTVLSSVAALEDDKYIAVHDSGKWHDAYEYFVTI